MKLFTDYLHPNFSIYESVFNRNVSENVLNMNIFVFNNYLSLGAGTRSRIQARLSGMNIYHARTSKLVSDFLYLEWSLVHNSAHAAHVPAQLQASWARV